MDNKSYAILIMENKDFVKITGTVVIGTIIGIGAFELGKAIIRKTTKRKNQKIKKDAERLLKELKEHYGEA